MSRPAHHSTVFAVLLIFCFTAQSLLLAPNINTSVFTSVPANWIIIGGWMFFILCLSLFAVSILDPRKTIRRIIFLISALMLGFLGELFFLQNSLVDAVCIWGLAIALIVISLELPKISKLVIQDWLPLISASENFIIGSGFLFFFLFPPLRGSIFHSTGLVFALIFIIPVASGIILRHNSKYIHGIFNKILAIPFIIFMAYVAIFSKDVLNLIPPACLAMSLIFIGVIPWESMRLAIQDIPGRRLFVATLCLDMVILAIFSYVLNRVAGYHGASINILIFLTNIFVLTFNLFLLATFIIIGSINLAINQVALNLTSGNENDFDNSSTSSIWAKTINQWISPVTDIQNNLISNIHSKDQEIQTLNSNLNNDKRRLTQLTLLNELEQKLKPILDPPVVAQLTVNEIQKYYDLAMITVFTYDYPRHEFVSMASAGRQTGTTPPEYRQPSNKGLIGRAARLRKAQYSPDTRLDPDFFMLENQQFLSEAAIPLVHQGLIKGLIVVDDDRVNAFSLLDIETLESIAGLVLASWNRSNYDERLRELIHAGITLTTTLETDVAISEIATIVQQTLAARFVLIVLFDQQRVFNRIASAGYAPRLMNYLNQDIGTNLVIQTVVNATRVHRMHDIRKLDDKLVLDNINLRGFLGFPIRMRGQRIGAILTFGKQGGVYFSEEDESLANLISNQAVASIETTWLYQQLSTAFNTTTRLYDLSNAILKTEKLSDAASAVVEAAFKLGHSKVAGIVLFNPKKEIEAQVQIDTEGFHPGQNHPTDLIRQALINNSTSTEIKEQIATVCLPLATPHRQYGVLWLRIPEVQWLNQRYADDLQTLSNQAALALERGILLVETQQQREQIQSAYRELEITYDQTLIALSAAVDARDQETEGHSVRVSKLTYHLGKHLGLPKDQLKSLERGALLHDIGKIGISDNILLKPGPLTQEEWHAMRQHPDIGARLIEGIPFLQDAIPVIRYHQERWDGSGYPVGMKGEDIPLQARVFAVADVFDALTSTRPYRQRVTINEAVKHLRNHAGIEFDPKIVDILEELAIEGEINEYLTP
jgi:putative nucleotidyltransferase with HDIG domain